MTNQEFARVWQTPPPGRQMKIRVFMRLVDDGDECAKELSARVPVTHLLLISAAR